MAVWTVFSRPSADDAEDDRGIVFVKEAFSFATLLFAPVVLLWHRLWLAFAAYVAVWALMAACVALFDLDPDVAFAVTFGFAVLLAFELPGLRMRKLARLGFAEEGSVVARNRAEAELRYFEGTWHDGTRDGAAPRRPVPSVPLPPRAHGLAPSSDIIGSFAGR